MRFQFVQAEKATYPVRLLCRTLEVSTSGFYAWQHRGPSARAAEDERLRVQIRAFHAASRRTYGRRRIVRDLRDAGHQVGHNRVAKLMRMDGLEPKRQRRYRVTTDSNHDHAVAPNILDRQFDVSSPNTRWAGDITYVWTRAGWLYLAVILDLFSRRVVGWATNDRIDGVLVRHALAMALRTREALPGLVHHSDRGSQYASHAFRDDLRRFDIVCSMSRRGNCWDNAVPESFFATLKGELVDHEDYLTREEATASIGEYIEVFYNCARRHSALGYVSPVAFETAAARNGAAA